MRKHFGLGKARKQDRNSTAISLAGIGNRKNDAIFRTVASDYHADLAF